MQPYLQLASLRLATTIPLAPRLYDANLLAASGAAMASSMAYIALLCAALAAVVALLRWAYRWSHPRSNGRLPPGSLGLPVIGETLQFFAPNPTCDLSPFVKERIKRYTPPPQNQERMRQWRAEVLTLLIDRVRSVTLALALGADTGASSRQAWWGGRWWCRPTRR